jgi:hypothetical protein
MSRKRHEMHKEHHRASGGRIGMKAAGNPDVFKEAEGEEPYAKGDERKHGGKVKKHKHGMHAEGKKSHHRMDRPKRARGGKVRGSDQAPFSSAHHSGKAGDMAGGEPD